MDIQKIKLSIKKIYATAMELRQRTNDNHLFLIAAGIAFNIMLYTIPLLLVAVYVLRIIYGADHISSMIEKFLSDILPPNEKTQEFLHSILKEVRLIFRKSDLVGWIGIISMFWLSSALFKSIRTGLNRVFGFKEKKIFLLYRVKDILLTFILATMVFISSFVMSSYTFPMLKDVDSLLSETNSDFLRFIFSSAAMTAVSIVNSFILFFFVFKFVPSGKTPGKVVYLSTTICVVLTELSRRIFGWYLTDFASYSKFYGTYAILISVAIWVFYLILILLLSAEISTYIFEKKKSPLEKEA